MNAIIVCLLAAVCASLCNLFFRKGSAGRSGGGGHLACHYCVAFLLALFLNPDIFYIPFSLPMACIGAVAGGVNIALLMVTFAALRRGPSGLTFALQNSSSVFTGAILFLLFGVKFGFNYSHFQILGMVLIMLGFFIGSNSKSRPSLDWLKYALGGFLIQLLSLVLIQWRCLLFLEDLPDHPLIPTTVSSACDAWFIPGLFGTAALIQVIYFSRENRLPNRSELLYGLATGSANSLTIFLLSFSTKWAGPMETTILFPCYAALSIVLCNIWAHQLYEERFNLISNLSCVLGILVSAVTVNTHEMALIT